MPLVTSRTIQGLYQGLAPADKNEIDANYAIDAVLHCLQLALVPGVPPAQVFPAGFPAATTFVGVAAPAAPVPPGGRLSNNNLKVISSILSYCIKEKYTASVPSIATANQYKVAMDNLRLLLAGPPNVPVNADVKAIQDEADVEVALQDCLAAQVAYNGAAKTVATAGVYKLAVDNAVAALAVIAVGPPVRAGAVVNPAIQAIQDEADIEVALQDCLAAQVAYNGAAKTVATAGVYKLAVDNAVAALAVIAVGPPVRAGAVVNPAIQAIQDEADIEVALQDCLAAQVAYNGAAKTVATAGVYKLAVDNAVAALAVIAVGPPARAGAVVNPAIQAIQDEADIEVVLQDCLAAQVAYNGAAKTVATAGVYKLAVDNAVAALAVIAVGPPARAGAIVNPAIQAIQDEADVEVALQDCLAAQVAYNGAAKTAITAAAYKAAVDPAVAALGALARGALAVPAAIQGMQDEADVELALQTCLAAQVIYNGAAKTIVTAGVYKAAVDGAFGVLTGLARAGAAVTPAMQLIQDEATNELRIKTLAEAGRLALVAKITDLINKSNAGIAKINGIAAQYDIIRGPHGNKLGGAQDCPEYVNNIDVDLTFLPGAANVALGGRIGGVKGVGAVAALAGPNMVNLTGALDPNAALGVMSGKWNNLVAALNVQLALANVPAANPAPIEAAVLVALNAEFGGVGGTFEEVQHNVQLAFVRIEEAMSVAEKKMNMYEDEFRLTKREVKLFANGVVIDKAPALAGELDYNAERLAFRAALNASHTMADLTVHEAPILGGPPRPAYILSAFKANRTVINTLQNAGVPVVTSAEEAAQIAMGGNAEVIANAVQGPSIHVMKKVAPDTIRKRFPCD